MHSCVYVITEKRDEKEINKALDPFNENDHLEFICEIKTEDLEAKFQEHVKKYKDRTNPRVKYKYNNAEEWAKEWFGYEKGTGGWGYESNPKSKWDWFIAGGRFCHIFDPECKDPYISRFNENCKKFSEIDLQSLPMPYSILIDGKWIATYADEEGLNKLMDAEELQEFFKEQERRQARAEKNFPTWIKEQMTGKEDWYLTVVDIHI